MDCLSFKTRLFLLVGATVVFASCATSKLAEATKEEPSSAEIEQEVPQKKAEQMVGTVAIVKASSSGAGFTLVRPVSKQTEVNVGATLETRDGAGRKTATLIRSAEDNRRFFVADIREGMPSEGDSVVALSAAPEMQKVPSGLPTKCDLPEGIDLNESLSLPPLNEADIRAMEP